MSCHLEGQFGSYKLSRFSKKNGDVHQNLDGANHTNLLWGFATWRITIQLPGRWFSLLQLRWWSRLNPYRSRLDMAHLWFVSWPSFTLQAISMKWNTPRKTNIAPEDRPSPLQKKTSSNHQFSGDILDFFFEGEVNSSYNEIFKVNWNIFKYIWYFLKLHYTLLPFPIKFNFTLLLFCTPP